MSSDTETDDGDGERSPPYLESKDSSSADDGDDSDGADAGGGGAGGSGGGGPIRFTGIHCTYICTHVSDMSTNYDICLIAGETQFTHATQDSDHEAPQSQRRTVGLTDYDTPQYSSSSYNDTS